MVNKEYSEAVFKQHLLNNIKNKTAKEQLDLKTNNDYLLKMELNLSSKEIIESVKDAFKHIPPRN